MFYKTLMCKRFEQGKCSSAENCNYAHGREDMREPPSNWRQLSGKKKGPGYQNDGQIIPNSQKVCLYFSNGENCRFEERCRYLHENPKRIKTDMANPLAVQNSGIGTETMGPVMEHGREAENTKLNVCRMWIMGGQCPFGERCHFPHTQSGMFTEGMPHNILD